VIAGLRPTKLSATAVFDGPIDGATFRASVEQVLVPTLRRRDVVGMDNLAVHKQPEVRHGHRAGGGAAPLPAAVQSGSQSVELAFAKLKAFVRAARRRSFDDVCALMTPALGLFVRDECANYIRHCGYRVTT
jgi:hypothetical protein